MVTHTRLGVTPDKMAQDSSAKSCNMHIKIPCFFSQNPVLTPYLSKQKANISILVCKTIVPFMHKMHSLPFHCFHRFTLFCPDCSLSFKKFHWWIIISFLFMRTSSTWPFCSIENSLPQHFWTSLSSYLPLIISFWYIEN